MRICRVIAAASLALGGFDLAGCTPDSTSSSPASYVPYVSNGCPSYPPPTVDITINVSGPVEDQKYSIAKLTKLHILGESRWTGRDYHTLGVTEANFDGTTAIDSRLEGSAGNWCIHAVRAEARVKWRIDVHLGAELVPGTCLYKAVQQHEGKHVARDRELMRVLKERLEVELVDVLRQPVWAANEAAAQQIMEDNVSASLAASLRDFEKERDQRQLEIDAPAEYARVQASCPDTELRAAVLGKTS